MKMMTDAEVQEGKSHHFETRLPRGVSDDQVKEGINGKMKWHCAAKVSHSLFIIIYLHFTLMERNHMQRPAIPGLQKETISRPRAR